MSSYSEIHFKGKLWHKTNGPAIINENGSWAWFRLGRAHRYYGPQNSNNGWRINGYITKN